MKKVYQVIGAYGSIFGTYSQFVHANMIADIFGGLEVNEKMLDAGAGNLDSGNIPWSVTWDGDEREFLEPYALLPSDWEDAKEETCSIGTDIEYTVFAPTMEAALIKAKEKRENKTI